MEKDTYSLYNAVKKLHQIDPAKSSYTLEEYKNLTQKHYHRFHEKTGIPKYAHKNDLGEKCFTKDKYVETIFYLYSFSEPFFKNLRLFKISSYDEIESINKKYYAFLTKHMSDILTPIEIARHYELFTLRSALDETKIYEDLRSKYCDYPKIMENMINWFNPMLQNDNRKNLKQKNIATSQANTFEEISSILEEFSTPYDERPQVSYIGLCRDVDRLFLLRKYYSAALDLYESHSAP